MSIPTTGDGGVYYTYNSEITEAGSSYTNISNQGNGGVYYSLYSNIT